MQRVLVKMRDVGDEFSRLVLAVDPEDVMSMMMFEMPTKGSISVVDLDLVTWSCLMFLVVM